MPHHHTPASDASARSDRRRARGHRCIYADDDGRFRPLPALYEALWHSVSHVLSINVFTVHAFPSRVVVAAYAFLVLIVSNTYTANLAAFLTVDQLETEINTVADLWGRNVATFPTYYRRLEQNHRILGDTSDSAPPVALALLTRPVAAACAHARVRGGAESRAPHARAHAGRNPQDCRNAVVAASDLVLRVKALEAEDITVNPARIEGGAANNVVPDLAILRFNIRPKSTDAMDRFDGELDAILRLIETEHEVGVHRHGGVTRPPKPVDAMAQRLFDLVKDCGAQLGQQIGWKSTGGVCDGNNIAATGGPVVDTMGVRGGAIHSPDEFMIVPSLRERAALSALVLTRLSTGDPL